MQPLTVEIWSDVVCPWCYIGKRRFEAALAQFAHREHVVITWRSFELDPAAPRHTLDSLDEMLARKYNVSLAQAADMGRRVTDLAAAEGLTYRLDQARPTNTFDAHRLIHFAADHNLQAEAKERLLQAYFTEGQAIGDPETLVRLGAELGLVADEVRTMLAGNTYADAVRADEQRAAALGIRGVPFFVIDERYGISGAQAADTLRDALEQIWAEHPAA
ncbi:MAG TPA: DsbA family oxidoreductase [Roseiflexaceae bacterium]|nr:DsbA family oxidoreductase [Roseiflexaceae bacterium]HMP42116.1 DsbA family oxidoreductase [Roseiflexaceae bacterium]